MFGCIRADMRRPCLSGVFLILCCLAVVPARSAEIPSVRLLVSNPAPYVGEELVVTLEVRTTPRPTGPIVLRWPNLDNCAVAELPPQPPRLEEEGRPVLVQIERRAVRPLRAGLLSLQGAGMSINGRNWTAPAQQLRVLALPDAGRPDDYAGAVGQATMRLEEHGRGNREIRLILRGTGPLDDFPAPLAAPGSGERLIPLGDATVGTAATERTRTLHYLYLPGDGDRGRLTFRLPLFDPVSRRYTVLKTGIRHLPVWPRHIIWTVAGLSVIASMILFNRLSRTPRTLDEALTHLLGQNVATLPRRDVLAGLRERGATSSLLAELTAYWDENDRRRFAPLSEIRPVTRLPGQQEQSLLRQLLKLRPSPPCS